ncbi:MAG: P1 family peptidase [Pseudomonadota bacterium]
MRKRFRDRFCAVGVMECGPNNTITDVPGVRVGHATLKERGRLNTGVTAIIPHDGDLYRRRVPAAVYAANGFGKMTGVLQLTELGELETPILLTGTLSVWRVADALAGHLLQLETMQDVRSINPVVGETNDGLLSDIRARPLGEEMVVQALADANDGLVVEGAVGAGAGTVCFGWKGGIGASSRRVELAGEPYLLGALVQSNFGGRLTICGVPVGDSLGLSDMDVDGEHLASADGSVMVVVATDAPLDSLQLGRLAKRAMSGVIRAGGVISHGSGDIVIAFSSSKHVRRSISDPVWSPRLLAPNTLTPLFHGVAEAVEESVYNSLTTAVTTVGHRGTAEALPLDRVEQILKSHSVLR